MEDVNDLVNNATFKNQRWRNEETEAAQSSDD